MLSNDPVSIIMLYRILVECDKHCIHFAIIIILPFLIKCQFIQCHRFGAKARFQDFRMMSIEL